MFVKFSSWCNSCLVFCNIVDRLDQIAQADEYSVVQQVHEYYADYYAVNPDLFNLNIPSMVTLGEPNFMTCGLLLC